MDKIEIEMLEEIVEALKDIEPMHITKCENYETCDYCNPSIELLEQIEIDDDDDDYAETLEIPFGIRMKCTEYARTEVSLWLDGGGDAYTKEEWEVYEPFLNDFLMGKLKPSTMVNAFALTLFQNDVDNRASVDYREGHHDDQPEIYNGGKYFDQKAKKLKAHLNKYNL